MKLERMHKVFVWTNCKEAFGKVFIIVAPDISVVIGIVARTPAAF
jgi:hypothetical protein